MRVRHTYRVCFKEFVMCQRVVFISMLLFQCNITSHQQQPVTLTPSRRCPAYLPTIFFTCCWLRQHTALSLLILTHRDDQPLSRRDLDWICRATSSSSSSSSLTIVDFIPASNLDFDDTPLLAGLPTTSSAFVKTILLTQPLLLSPVKRYQGWTNRVENKTWPTLFFHQRPDPIH